MSMTFDKLPETGIQIKKFIDVDIRQLFVFVDEDDPNNVAMRLDANHYVYLDSGYMVPLGGDELQRDVYLVKGTLQWNFISE